MFRSSRGERKASMVTRTAYEEKRTKPEKCGQTFIDEKACFCFRTEHFQTLRHAFQCMFFFECQYQESDASRDSGSGGRNGSLSLGVSQLTIMGIATGSVQYLHRKLSLGNLLSIPAISAGLCNNVSQITFFQINKDDGSVHN